ncbi:MAG: peroxiredoxin-like family protein [Deltaproteobacteria bacterium]
MNLQQEMAGTQALRFIPPHSTQGHLPCAVGEGDIAPDFTLINAEGRLVNLSEALTRRPVVLGFYEGRWCHFCNRALKAMEKAHFSFNKMETLTIMISPHTAEYIREFKGEKRLTLNLLSDPGNCVAEAYGLDYAVPKEIRRIYLHMGIDLKRYNGDASWRLPMPARYIIDQDRIIRYARITPGHIQQPEPTDLLEVLQDLRI